MLREFEIFAWMKGDYIETLDRSDVAWQSIDVIAKVMEDNEDYVKCFLLSWMNNLFSYIIIRYADMTGVGIKFTVKHFKDLSAIIRDLSTEGMELYKSFEMEV